MDGERFLSRGVGAATCKNGGKTVGTGKKEAPPNQAAKKNTENSTGKSGKFEKKNRQRATSQGESATTKDGDYLFRNVIKRHSTPETFGCRLLVFWEANDLCFS